FEMGYFLEESGFLIFADAYLATARTQVLDYFYQQRLSLREDHIIFRFEQSMDLGIAEGILINQLCIQMGFMRGPKYIPAYLSGEDPLIVDNYPEMALFRDIVFLFKALLAPTSTALPGIRPWQATDARLEWHVVSPEGVEKNGARIPARL